MGVRKIIKILPYFIIEKVVLSLNAYLIDVKFNDDEPFKAYIYEFEEGVWLIRSVEYEKRIKKERLLKELKKLEK